MEKLIPLYTGSGVFLLFLLAFILRLSKQFKLEKLAAFTGCLLCGTGVGAMTILLKRPPLYGPYESVIYIIFILSLLLLLPGNALLKGLSKTDIPTATYIFIMAVFIFLIGKPIAFNNDYYMYGDIRVIIFFNFRLIAAALFIYAAIIINTEVLSRNKSKNGERELYNRSCRNFLLAGIAFYLISEWAGSIWCLNWLGDTWLWSKGFFKSSIIFLLVMIICHLPPSFSKMYRTKAVLATTPAVFILWMIFYH